MKRGSHWIRMACLAVGVAIAAPCVAYDGSTVRLPVLRQAGAPPFSARAGLAIEVDTRGFGQGGYRPLRVRIDAKAGAGADRVIDFKLCTQNPQIGGITPALTVERRLVLPANQTSVEVLVMCPWLEQWSSLWWEVRVDGREDSQLAMPRGASWATFRNTTPSMLRLLRPTRDDDWDPLTARGGGVKPLSKRGGLQVEDAFSEPMPVWLGYASADVVVLALDQLNELIDDTPDEAEALRRWVLAGGSLWIERVEGTPDSYQELDKRLGLAAWRFTATAAERPDDAPAAALAEAEALAASEGTGDDDADSDATPKRRPDLPVEGAPGWTHLNLAGTDSPSDAARRVGERLRAGRPVDAFEAAFGSVADSRGWFAVREAGFGQVVAFDRTPLDLPIRMTNAAAMRGMTTWTSKGWPQRHGIEPGMTTPAFGNLLIPGVGAAPVGEFQVLITLFVLAIGPLNYWLLWRRNQVHLLVLTTPLAALIVTLGLAGYAAISDGFGVKARVRSVTLLNQATGEAASWSRVSHYAAVAPDEPAVIPGDAALTPIQPAWESAIAQPPAARRLAWQDGAQVLTSGWIPPRTATQHLIVRSRVTDARVAFAKQGEALQATNRLNTELTLLLVYDSDRKWRIAEQLEADASTTLQTVSRLDALRAFRGIALENQPTFPIGAGRAVEQTLELLGESRNLRRRQRQMSGASLSSNLLNQTIGALTGLDGGIGLDVPPRSYVAVAETAIETPLGWEDVREVDSFHVIAGRW